MKTRMVASVVGMAAVLWGCDQAPPSKAVGEGTKQVQVTPVPAREVPKGPVAVVAPVPPPAPKPVVLSKPVVLGPMGPAIVILPARMAEPQIRIRLTPEEDRAPVIGGGKYRGRVETVRLANGKYVAINVVPLDSYLQGVLAKELYGSWDAATYRAQAIAARTFALFEMLTDGRAKQWDVNDDESSQMYGGIAGETAKSKAAVAATRGQVLTAEKEGKTGIFCSRYSACIGGASQDPFEAWGDATVGPLAAHFTENVDDNCDKYRWNKEFVATKADVTRCVQSWGQKNDFAHLRELSRIESVVINKRNAETQRPTELMLTDAAGRRAPIRAEEFRLALMYDPQGRAPKPYSSNCDIRMQGDAVVMYNGKGYGHGIGLSQWGAQKLATEGYSHTRILAYFYPGAGMQGLW